MRASRLPTAEALPPARAERTAATAVSSGPPLVLNRYALRQRLGTGAFGTVWRADDERLGRQVAVKILARERVLDGRFEREARAAARLAHPGIVTLYEAAVDDEGAYLVSELVHGSTLQRLHRDGRLSDRDVLTIAIALCDALVHAHAHGVVHRDVKPSNVLVPDRPPTAAQVAKLTDFGVARVVGGDSLTRTGDVIGTAAYMAPEQAEGRPAGEAADLYALALVTYEALTGVNPVGTTAAAQRARRLGAHLPPLRRQRRDLPRELGRGIDLALRPRASERGTLDELRGALTAALHQVDDEPGAIEETDPRPTMEWRIATETPRRPPAPPHPVAEDREADRPEDAPATRPRPSLRVQLPARVLAAAAAALLAAWITAHLLNSIAPAAAALIAGGLVFALPRAGWATVALAAVVASLVQHHPGLAILLALGAAIPVACLPRSPSAWPLPVTVPLLGAITLAGAWPALAGRSQSAVRRAGLGAAGWLWLLLAGSLTGRALYLGGGGGAAASPPNPRSASTYDTWHHVVLPLLRPGLLAPAAVWAAAALVLPHIVRRRSVQADLLRVAGWTTLTALLTASLLAGAHRAAPGADVALGAVAAGLTALSGPVLRRRRTPGPDFRSMDSP